MSWPGKAVVEAGEAGVGFITLTTLDRLLGSLPRTTIMGHPLQEKSPYTHQRLRSIDRDRKSSTRNITVQCSLLTERHAFCCSVPSTSMWAATPAQMSLDLMGLDMRIHTVSRFSYSGQNMD